MNPKTLLSVLSVAEKLKCQTRHCYTSNGRRESVAEHSWRLALMAMLLRDEFEQADMDKVIRMCLIHDLGEAFTGDIPAFEKNDSHRKQEDAALEAWIAGLPTPYGEKLAGLFSEMQAMQSLEAKIYKALDNLEAVIQHNESDIATWLPLEYDLQMTYGADKVAFSPYLTLLKAEIDRWTRRKMEEAAPRGEA